MFYSPLRYPGGKGKLEPFMELLIRQAGHVGGTYVEPFAGGAGIALELLEKEIVNDIVINDLDKGIYSFWRAILSETDRFTNDIRNVELTIDEWNRQRQVIDNCNRYSYELGFATFYLNRTNRSGIIKGGVIGGAEQAGNWRMDARFNREDLIERIIKIAKRKNHIHLYNKDVKTRRKTMKPKLHFTAPYHWINDPNGLIYYKGNYHIFYQHFPYDNKWGTMHWGHAITKDFVNFEHLPIALYPSKDFDRNGCFSGSAIEIDGQLYLYYTAIKYAKENPSNVHNQYSDDDLRASQALVVSSDGIHFDNVKNKKQIIPMIQEAYIGDYRHTRDPKVWKKQDGKYAMVIGSKVAYENDYCGKALFYESEDGIHFEYKNSYQEPTIGNMWECPDVFKINNQFFMIFSPENTDLPPKPNSNARYMPIDFEEDTLTIKEHGDWPYLDHGLDFYAPQTFLSKDNERLLLGWLRMRKPVQGEEWVGMFIMPRVLKEKEGKIIQELYPEIKNSFNQEIQDISFDQPFQLKTTLNKDSSLNLGGFKIDIQDDCLHLNREEVSIQENKVCNDVISPKLQGHYDIELYYDHHVFEIYINGGEYVMSQVVYDLNDQVIIQNTEYKVYVRSL